MEEELKPGDVVQLKCGGISMVIEKINEDRKDAKCVWIADNQRKEAEFLLVVLTKKPSRI